MKDRKMEFGTIKAMLTMGQQEGRKHFSALHISVIRPEINP